MEGKFQINSLEDARRLVEQVINDLLDKKIEEPVAIILIEAASLAVAILTAKIPEENIDRRLAVLESLASKTRLQ